MTVESVRSLFSLLVGSLHECDRSQKARISILGTLRCVLRLALQQPNFESLATTSLNPYP